MPEARIPEVVGTHYRVRERLAGGGMAEVFLAEDLRNGKTVALKVLRAEQADRARLVERFRREASILDQVDHPAVVGILDCGVAEHLGVFLALEYVEGQTFLDYIRDRAPIPPSDLVVIVDGICDALEAVHKLGIVHRDLKPSNVIVADGGETTVKLIDFGVSKALRLERLTVTGELVGTPRFMAPEQLRDARDVDGRADLYALGIGLYIALSAKLPFEGSAGEMLIQILSGRIDPLLEVAEVPLSAAIGQVVGKATAINPEDRYQSARELADAFRSAAGTSDSSTRAITVAVAREEMARRFEAEKQRLREERTQQGQRSFKASDSESNIPGWSRSAPKVFFAALFLALVGGLLASAAWAVHSGVLDSPFAAASPSGISHEPARQEAAPLPSGASGESPEPSTRREITLSTTPAAAMVKEDGATIGSTPLTLRVPAEGSRLLTIDLPAYVRTPVRIRPSSRDLHLELDPIAEPRATSDRPVARAGTNAPNATNPGTENVGSMTEPEPNPDVSPSAIVCPWCGRVECAEDCPAHP